MEASPTECESQRAFKAGDVATCEPACRAAPVPNEPIDDFEDSDGAIVELDEHVEDLEPGKDASNDPFAEAHVRVNEEPLTETHIQANKEAAIFEKWAPYMFIGCLVFLFVTGTALIACTLALDSIDLDKRFWFNQVATLGVISIFQFGAGWAALHWGVKVNYTRKFIHFNYFAWPLMMEKLIMGYDSSIISGLWKVWIVLFALVFVSEPLVERAKLFRIMYAAIDRPEDRPYTRLWFISQLCTSLPIIAVFHIWFGKLDQDDLVFIPIVILALGDGLAEPVGVRFGKHKYKVPRLCGRDCYYRSWEGSSMVFLVSVIAVAAHFSLFTRDEFIFSMMTMPFLMTLTEAWAPHTWDNPLILFVGYSVLVCAHYGFGDGTGGGNSTETLNVTETSNFTTMIPATMLPATMPPRGL